MSESDTSDSARGGSVDQQALGEHLIRQAFEQARETGRDDWASMRATVLKNRILSLEESFDEREWGVERFGDFLDLYHGLVSVDRTLRPPLVRLLEEAAGDAERSMAWSGPRTRIRPDLWRAVMDVDTPEPYGWDGSAAARGASEPDRPTLPTVTSENLAEWRRSFVEQARAAHGDAFPEDRVSRWVDTVQSARTLPQPIQVEWTMYLKRRVQERLEHWFAEQGIPAPPDMVSETTARERDDSDTDRLRRLVVGAVEAMSRQELEELRLPARVLLCAKR